jgi:hypothetical protein
MPDPIATYLHDHLAGARLALSLLQDLSEQQFNPHAAHLAAGLLPEIEADRVVLEDLAKQIGEGSNPFKDAAAWVAQKAGRLKLTLHEPLGIFEAVEMLALGVLGKLALWNALETVREIDGRLAKLDFARLESRARNQHQLLESLRLQLAATALQQSDR